MRFLSSFHDMNSNLYKYPVPAAGSDLRLVAGDASVLMPAIRQCGRTKRLAAPDQRLFALCLPGAELTLHAAVRSVSEAERTMLANALANALDKLGPDDVLLLDRGYPAAWLVNLLNARGLRFIIRCDTTSGGWRSLRQFIRSDLHDATITSKPPKAQDVADWSCLALLPIAELMPRPTSDARPQPLCRSCNAPCRACSSASTSRNSCATPWR